MPTLYEMVLILEATITKPIEACYRIYKVNEVRREI